MSDVLSAAERQLIEDHVRRNGVTRCPPRVFTEGLVHPAGSSSEAKALSRRIQARGRRFKAACGVKAAPPADIQRMIRMAETMTAREIADALDLNVKTVARRLKRHGAAPVRQADRDMQNRREVVRVMMAEGASARQITAATGADDKTVRCDIEALVLQGCPRKQPENARNRTDIARRRVHVRKLRAEGLSIAQIAGRLNARYGVVQSDVHALERCADG